MAHFLKATIPVAQALIKHCSRTEHTRNENVDGSLSRKNEYIVPHRSSDEVNNSPKYSFEEISPEDVDRRYKERISGVSMMKRADVKSMVSLIVQAPEGYSEEDAVRFLKLSTAYASERWGEKNIIAGCIHLDEPSSRPHVHILMTPIVQDKKRNREKVCAKKFLTREDYNKLHPHLEGFIRQYPGLPPFQLMNGVTKEKGGNRTVSQLKLDTALERVRERESALMSRERAVQDREKALQAKESAWEAGAEERAKAARTLEDAKAAIRAAQAAQAAAAKEADRLQKERQAESRRKEEWRSELEKRDFSKEDMELFQLIPETLRPQALYIMAAADAEAEKKIQSMAKAVQLDHIGAGMYRITAPRTVANDMMQLLRSHQREDEYRRLCSEWQLGSLHIKKMVQWDLDKDDPTKEDGLAALCGRENLRLMRDSRRKPIIEKAFHQLGLTQGFQHDRGKDSLGR